MLFGVFFYNNAKEPVNRIINHSEVMRRLAVNLHKKRGICKHLVKKGALSIDLKLLL